MNFAKNINKYQKRNSSPSPFNIKLIPSLNSNNPNTINNTSFFNQNNINYSYSDSSSENNDKEINNETQCPNCLSYQINLNEKKLLIQKLQNQLNKYNSSNAINQINNYKKTITNLKNEINNKIEEISLLRLNQDEKLNALITRNQQLEEEIINLKNNNILLNKSNIELQKYNKIKEIEIKQYKEKIKVLLNKISSKNNISFNYNTLALSSGGNHYIKYNNQNPNPKHIKAKTNIEFDSSNDDNEDKLADILLNSGNIIKSKSHKINYDSGSESNIMNLNIINKFNNKKDFLNKTPKMSSTQSSWMISPVQKELIKNEQLLKKLIDENTSLKNKLAESFKSIENSKKIINLKNNEIIKYQREYINKKNQLEKIKSASKSNSVKKIPIYPPNTTNSNKKTTTTINKGYSPKINNSPNNIKEFEEYPKGLIDDSEDEENKVKEKENIEDNKLRVNKSSSNLKNYGNNLLMNNKDMQINLLNSKLNEKIKTIKSLEQKINELQNENNYITEIKANKEDLEIKLKKYINENNDLLKRIESKNNLIKETETKLEKLKNSLEEKNLIILNKEKLNEEIQNKLSLIENKNKENDIIIKSKEENIILLQKKIGVLNESINKYQNDIK